MFFSTLHHLFMCHSENVFHFFYKCDSFGSLFMALGINFAMNFYIYYCDNFWKISYILISNFFALLIGVMVFHPKFNQTKYRVIRVWLFVFFGIISSGGVLHSLAGYAPDS